MELETFDGGMGTFEVEISETSTGEFDIAINEVETIEIEIETHLALVQSEHRLRDFLVSR